MEEVLHWFMFAIPRARGRPVDAWCSRPDGAAVRRAAKAAMIAEQVGFACVSLHSSAAWLLLAAAGVDVLGQQA
jgi:hypothetical protein